MKLSNLIALLTNRTVAGNAYVKDGELYQGNTAQAILVKDENELSEVQKHVAPGSIAYTAGCASMWQLSAAGSWEPIQEEGGSGGGGGAMVLTLTETETGVTLDATYAEVKAAMMSGRDVVYVLGLQRNKHLLYKLIECDDATDHTHGDQYIASFYNPVADNPDPFYADTENGELYFTFGD